MRDLPVFRVPGRDRPLPWAAVAAVAVVLVLLSAWLSRRYSHPDPWHRYAEAVRGAIQRGLAADSAGLALRAEPAAAAWVLRLAREQPALARDWARGLVAASGTQQGDTVTVALAGPPRPECGGGARTTARLVEDHGGPRLVAIDSPCVR